MCWEKCSIPERKIWILFATNEIPKTPHFPKTVLLFGADSRIGQYVCHELLRNGSIDYVISSSEISDGEILKELATDENRLKLISLDANNPNLGNELEKIIARYGLNIIVHVSNFLSKLSEEIPKLFTKNVIDLFGQDSEDAFRSVDRVSRINIYTGSEEMDFRQQVKNSANLSTTEKAPIFTTTIRLVMTEEEERADGGREMTEEETKGRESGVDWIRERVITIVENIPHVNTIHNGEVVTINLQQIPPQV